MGFFLLPGDVLYGTDGSRGAAVRVVNGLTFFMYVFDPVVFEQETVKNVIVGSIFYGL